MGDSEPAGGPAEAETGEAAGPVAAPRKIGRRRFLKYAAVGGVAAAAGALGLGYLTGFIRIGGQSRPAWEIADGVVDYDRVPIPERGSTLTLRIAQWFDYWQPKFLDDSDWSFRSYMQSTYGIDVHYLVDYFTSNEELFLWISPLQKKEYDVIFPSNYYVELLNNANWIYNLKKDWLPNMQHLDPRFVNVPADKPFDRRPNGEQVSLPYFWGTTGIGYRTDYISAADIEAQGWDFFLQSTYQSEQLAGRMNLLDDERDVITMGLKGAGWKWQESQGLTPTGMVPPDGQQWTSNDVEDSKTQAARNYLLQAKPNLFSFTSTNVIPSLQNGVAWANQGWSGDIVNAIAPDSAEFPIDYIVPRQGGTWWVDCMAIHSKSKNIWLAHQFMNYIHQPDVMVRLTEWNKYSCANLAAWELLGPQGLTGWEIKYDPRLYPDDAAWRRLDLTRDVGLDVTQRVYDPLWEDLKFG